MTGLKRAILSAAERPLGKVVKDMEKERPEEMSLGYALSRFDSIYHSLNTSGKRGFLHTVLDQMTVSNAGNQKKGEWRNAYEKLQGVERFVLATHVAQAAIGQRGDYVFKAGRLIAQQDPAFLYAENRATVSRMGIDPEDLEYILTRCGDSHLVSLKPAIRKADGSEVKTTPYRLFKNGVPQGYVKRA